jgi:hypothetical protein
MPVEIFSETPFSAVTPLGYVFDRFEIINCMAVTKYGKHEV